MRGHEHIGRLARRRMAVLLTVGALAGGVPARAETAPEGEIAFFDPLVTFGPGISRELDVTVDHIRGSDTRLTVTSVKIQ